jgi:anti-anti-sigma factor
VIDLNRVSFIDSAALHVLFTLARGRRDGLVIVVEPTAQIARTLAIAGLDRAATLVPSFESVSPPAGIG